MTPEREAQIVEDKARIIAWMNAQDFFWLFDLRKAMGLQNADNTTPMNITINLLMQKLRKSDYIQCCSATGAGKQQYVRLRLIPDNF